ncbi:MAG: RNA polymerase sigma factor [Acidimicrobiales bacterium]
MAELYVRFHPPVLGYLRSQFPAQGEDLASDVWLGVAAGLRRFSGDESAFRRWVFTIARRRLIDARRQASRRRTDPTDREMFAARPGSSDPEREVISAMSGAEAVAWIRERLPPAQAEAVVLRVIGGMSVEETAAVMGRRPGAVRVLQHRALTRLAVELRRLGDGVAQEGT